MSAETEKRQNTDFGEKHGKTRQIMAWAAIAAIVIFVAAACVCMVIGDFRLVIASCFCLVVIPIVIYCFIMVYDMVHKDDKKYAGMLEEAETEEQSDEGDGEK